MGALIICSIFVFNLAFLLEIAAISSIDNGLVGDPQVSCGPENIEVSASTKAPFEGVVYIKDWRRSSGCFSVIEQGVNSSQPRLSVPLHDLSRCGMEMKRKQENGDVVIRGVWVFSFHPMFVTKVDRAFAVHCIFKQKELTVTSRFSVNDLSTKSIGRTATMPNIGMKIITGTEPDPQGQQVTVVKVGDPVLFVWFLPAPSTVVGLRVRHCTAESRKGNRVQILDNGCTTDEVAITDVKYSKEMDKAYASAHAFKFADNEDMWFKCTVSVCMKMMSNSSSPGGRSDDACETIKICSPNGRIRRDLSDRGIQAFRELDDDIAEQKLTILDSYNRHTDAVKPTRNVNSTKITFYSKQSVRKWPKQKPWVVCMRKPIFALISSVVLLMYVATFILAALAVVVYCRRKNDQNSVLGEFCDRRT